MLLSICIPTFNRKSSLKNCLNSILISDKFSKNFNYEVCVSDNCSQEDVTETILEFKNKLNKSFKSIFPINIPKIVSNNNIIYTVVHDIFIF